MDIYRSVLVACTFDRLATLTNCCRVVFIDHRVYNLLLYNAPSMVQSNHAYACPLRLDRTRTPGITAQRRKQARTACRNGEPKQERGTRVPVDDRTEELQVRFARFRVSARRRYSLEHPGIRRTMAF